MLYVHCDKNKTLHVRLIQEKEQLNNRYYGRHDHVNEKNVAS